MNSGGEPTSNVKRSLRQPLAGTPNWGGQEEWPRRSFDDLLVGEENKLAIRAARKLAAQPEDFDQPLFLFGSPGTGKSHLLYGLAHRLAESFPDWQILATSAGQFAEECDHAWSNRATGALRRYLWHVDALIVDDLHLLAKREAALEELLHAHNKLQPYSKPMIFASALPPGDLHFPVGLRNRLSGGLVVGIEPPRPSLMQKVLDRLCLQAGLKLSAQAGRYLAQEIGDLREAGGVISKLEEFTPGRRRSVRQVSLKLVRELIERLVSPPLDLATVVAATCEYYQVPLPQVRSARRHRRLSEARQQAMHLVRTMTSTPFAEIGKYFGGRDHTSVMYACQKAEEALATDPRFGRAAREIRRALRETLLELS